jgi:hypothetical protein
LICPATADSPAVHANALFRSLGQVGDHGVADGPCQPHRAGAADAADAADRDGGEPVAVYGEANVTSG